MKSYLIMTAAVLTLVAMPLAADAQGLVRGTRHGVHRGAYEGGRAAGPVGAVVGGVVGGAVGGAIGTVNGALGLHPYYYHGHRYYRRY